MATVVDTSTVATATASFNGRKVDRNQDGTVWAVHNNGTPTAEFWYSKDDGATWTFSGTASDVLGATNASLFIDLDDYAHFVWQQSGTGGGRTAGYVYYMRGTPNAERTAWTWSAAVRLNATLPTNVTYDYPDVVAFRTPGSSPTTWDATIVASRVFSGAGPANHAVYERLRIANDGTVTADNLDGLSADNTMGLLSGNYAVNAHTYPSIDFNHTGDGKTVAGDTPHLYVGWTAGATGAGKGVRFRKAVYSAGSWTWNAEREIDSTKAANGAGNALLCHFDGTRVVLAAPSINHPGVSSERLWIVDRDAADTTTSAQLLVTPASTAEVLAHGSVTFDSAGNVYLLGRDSTGAGGTRLLNWRKWTRTGATLGPITTFDSTGSDTPYVSAKRGYSASSIDWVWTDGTASPFSVTFDRVALNVAPNAPTLVAPADASTADLAAGYEFDWTFSDPDSGDSQSAWAMRRKISGAASYEYWNVATAAWQSTEVWNSSTTTEYTFAADKWSSGNTYNWSVATKDAAGVAGPYASDFTVTAGAPPTVEVTAPSGTITDTDSPTVTWSYSDPESDPQVTYHVKVYDAATYGATGFDPSTTAAQFDSTETTSTDARSHSVTVDLVNGTTYRAYVRCSQSGSQYSAWAFSGFTLSLTAPSAPTLVATAEDAQSRVALAVTGTHADVDFPSVTFVTEFSDDGGTTWTAVRNGSAAGNGTPDATAVTVYDYEPPPNVARTYRAKTKATV